MGQPYTLLLARSVDLWNGDWALGGLQNQASGYLFPIGPAFVVGDAAYLLATWHPATRPMLLSGRTKA